MTKLYKVKDITGKVKDAELYGHVANKLQNDLTTDLDVLRNFSDEKNDTSPSDEWEIKNISSGNESELFYTNELTLSCWVYLIGESEASCGVITNGDDTNRCGLLIEIQTKRPETKLNPNDWIYLENKLEQNSDGDDVWSEPGLYIWHWFAKTKMNSLGWATIMIYPSGKAKDYLLIIFIVLHLMRE